MGAEWYLQNNTIENVASAVGIGANIAPISQSSKKETQKQKKKNMVTVKKYSASWCRPCRQLSQIFSSVKAQFSGQVQFMDVDVDNDPQDAKHNFVMSVPTVIIFKNGNEVGRFTGVRSLNEYITAIQNYI